MKALAKKLAFVQDDWAPNAFIRDCAHAEIGGLQCVWHGVKYSCACGMFVVHG